MCCIVFDIDGIHVVLFLYEFFSSKLFVEYFLSHFMFSLRFMLFPKFLETNISGTNYIGIQMVLPMLK